MFECPKILLDNLNCTRAKMEITGERVVYKRSLMIEPSPIIETA